MEFRREPIKYLLETNTFYRTAPKNWENDREVISARNIRVIPYCGTFGCYVKIQIIESFVSKTDVITGTMQRVPLNGEITVFDYDIKSDDLALMLRALALGDIRGELANKTIWNVFYTTCIKDRKGKNWLKKWVPELVEFYVNFEKEKKDAKKRKSKIA